jgi:hypothetical protein
MPAAKSKPADKGLCFPKDPKGSRSTSTAGKNIIATALRGAKTAEGDKFAALCEKEKNWRFGYNKHFKNLVKVSASSPDAALGVARAGTEFMHSAFDFVDPKTGSESNFFSYMTRASEAGSFETGVINGTGEKGGKLLTVPYKGAPLAGNVLKAQLERWANYGTIEADAALSMSKLANGKLDLNGQYFVLIGAGSAMGPFLKLLEHGATVVCIDIPGAWGDRPQGMWKRLIETARASPGSIIFPLGKKQSACKTDQDLFAAAGSNLTEQPAQLVNWLASVAPGQRLTVGNYTYLDGDLHVKLSLAADAVINGLCSRRKDTAVAFLCTPTDLHIINDSSHQAAVANYGWHPGRLLEAFFQVYTYTHTYIRIYRYTYIYTYTYI